jgi:hypothetical protein
LEQAALQPQQITVATAAILYSAPLHPPVAVVVENVKPLEIMAALAAVVVTLALGQRVAALVLATRLQLVRHKETMVVQALIRLMAVQAAVAVLEQQEVLAAGHLAVTGVMEPRQAFLAVR